MKVAMKKRVSDPPVPNEDFDSDQNDIDLEMNIEQATSPSRMVQQALWLVVSYQQVMEVVTNRRVLPKFPLSLTFLGPPTKRSITEMESWKDVIHSMYPSTTTPSTQPSSQQAITAQEAINALTIFDTLLMRPTEEELLLFKNTYGTIGVSKRCCPVCTKLLSLLSKHSQGQIEAIMGGSGNRGMPVLHQPELKVLNSHRNIYPTALPPFLPKEVAEELVKWLEGLLKQAVEKVVKRERRGSSGSADSKGQSPEGSGREELPQVRFAPRGNTAAGGGPWRQWTAYGSGRCFFHWL
ncbi:hypothetical protein EV426DRAFT_699353 [Tirmania nivea]|nr:hypothetical protein EV426DRAFT_699353 [Tirmania nivea]